MPTRVVSLVPSTTETLLAWGVDVVACTRFCEQPQLRHVGGTKDPDVAAIVALAPDLVVVDREENRREDAEALAAAGLRVHVTDVVSLAQVPAVLSGLAAAAGIVPQPPHAAAEPAVARAEPSGGPSRPAATVASAFVPIWRRPWMSINGDTYGSTLLAHLGVANVLAGAADRYPVVELDDIAALAPDLVLLPSEPYEFRERHEAELAGALPGAACLRVDGRDLFWWGVRTEGALARLRDALRPVLPPR